MIESLPQLAVGVIEAVAGYIMPFYRRHLPHWQPASQALFITWRLYGSLPKPLLLQLKLEQQARKTGAGQARMPVLREAAARFRAFDRILDKAQSGPLWLKEPQIAERVVEALHYGAESLGLYQLYAYVVMANHVHILIQPRAPLAKITRAIKGYTALEANRRLERSGHPFWQDESFDHWVRSTAEFAKIFAYIENNPVRAGLVSRPQDWPWSSAHASGRTGILPRFSLDSRSQFESLTATLSEVEGSGR